MVTGRKEGPAVRQKRDLLKEDLATIAYVDGKPMVTIKDAAFEGLCEPWRDALVIKLLGKSIGYHTMKDRLSRIWKLQAGFEIMDIGHGFYMAKFDMEGDRMKVMEEGPWMIFDHYLTVQTWTPEFMSPSAKIDKTMVWVRFPGLNLIYYDESILMTMASTIGKPIKVDANTLDVRRGRFARVCVEIDLTKPVIGKVGLQGFWYHVEYEGLHRLCTKCGCYGHLTRDCTVAGHIVSHAPDGKKDGDGAANKDSSPPPNMEQNKAVTDCEDKETDITAIKEPLYGDWMVVKRKQHKKPKPFFIGTEIKGKPIMGNHGKKDKQVVSNSQVVSSKSNNKRQRAEIGGPSKLGQTSKPKPPINKNNSANKGPNTDPPKPAKPSGPKPINDNMTTQPRIFDLGHGVKSAVLMKAVTPNQFVLLNDENVDHTMDNMHEDNIEDSTHIVSHGNMVQVPETQLEDDFMAT